jgi:ferritin-like metal-binding protein YciE
MALATLHDLMIDNMKDLYNAEKQLVAALPKLAKTAKTEELREALEHHLRQTENHVSRLENAFELLGVPARGKTCKGMEGLIEEGKEIMDEDGDDAVKDAGLIAAAQKVEHYEISGYGTVITYAEMLGEKKVAQLLEDTLEEEKKADQKLTQLAETAINARAINGGDVPAGAGGGRKRSAH